MYYSDPMKIIAVERQVERVRAVEAYGLPHMPKPAALSWPMDDAPRNWRPGHLLRAGR
jgi:hypothetical protein